MQYMKLKIYICLYFSLFLVAPSRGVFADQAVFHKTVTTAKSNAILLIDLLKQMKEKRMQLQNTYERPCGLGDINSEMTDGFISPHYINADLSSYADPLFVNNLKTMFLLISETRFYFPWINLALLKNEVLWELKKRGQLQDIVKMIKDRDLLDELNSMNGFLFH